MLINLPTNETYHIKHAKEENPVQNDFQMHAHSHYELLYFLSGDITYIVEGNYYKPKPHDILLFDIAETHKVVVNSNQTYERIVIQMNKDIFSQIDPENSLFTPFTNKKLGQNNLIHPSDFNNNLWKICISRLTEGTRCDSLTAVTFLLPLLNELKHSINKSSKSLEKTSTASKVVQYINEHITEPLLPSDIAKQFFISRTALYTLFKASTGSGIHDYINVKRLIMAQDLLKSGEKPTKVYEKCGFKDYTTFFRAYKSHFLVSPKEYTKA